MNHYIEIALRGSSHILNRFLLSIKTFLIKVDLFSSFKANKKLFLISLAFLSLALLLVLFPKPYLAISQTPIALKMAQSNHLNSLLIESKSLRNDGQSVVTFDNQELEKLKKILINKGMMVVHLSINANDVASIEMQLKHVSFASFIDVLNESKEIWHLYPLKVSIDATDSAGIVDVKATLKQFGGNQFPPSFGSQN